jgi:hypothetical protein
VPIVQKKIISKLLTLMGNNVLAQLLYAGIPEEKELAKAIYIENFLNLS